MSLPPPGLRSAVSRALRTQVDRLTAREVSRVSRWADVLLQWRPTESDHGARFERIDAPRRVRTDDAETAATELGAGDRIGVVLLDGNLNHTGDVQGELEELGAVVHRSTRVTAVLYSPYVRHLYRLLTRLGLRSGPEPTTFLTRTAFRQVARLAGFEVVRLRPVAAFPFRWLFVGSLLNRLLLQLPGLRWVSPVAVAVLRPVLPTADLPSLSIVVPARNEEGNLGEVLSRLTGFEGVRVEVIFVEGHSTDGTWKAIESLVASYEGPFVLQAHQQTGRGKNDAVRLGFEKATGELLTILDADLTMPPERLQRFYRAYRDGLGDFVNGSRLVYPMEEEAMRFLNHLGNVGFAKLLAYVLEIPISDSLCGTKLVPRWWYRSFLRWRDDFGDFDPFGDFELLFPAASLACGVCEVPVRYRARTYGSTNIRRFSDGARLLRMTIVGFLRLRLGFSRF